MSRLQTIQDESHEGTARPGPDKACRLEQGPYQIELRGGGWAGPVGRASKLTTESSALRVLPQGDLRFTRVNIDAFIFHQVSSVLVLQGMTLQDLFPPDARFACVRGNIEQQVLARGPFIFLKGALSEGWDPPLRLKGVVLAALESVPAGVTREEVLDCLLKEVV